MSCELSFGDVWFNAPVGLMPASGPRMRGVAEGQGLARLLGAEGRSLAWNTAFGGKQAEVPDDGFVEVAGLSAFAPRITLLSPTRVRLAALERSWDRELEKLRKREHNERAAADAISRRRGGTTMDLEAMAARVTPEDGAVPNGSSIALLIEHRGASAMLAADAFPSVMLSSLAAFARARGETPLRVDAFKLSHHASRANVTRELLDAVVAKHYIVSTNGAIFGHPNEEALARVLLSGRGAAGASTPKTLWFNYVSPKVQPWLEPTLGQRHGYAVAVPEGDGGGVTIRLPAAAMERRPAAKKPAARRVPTS